MTNNEMISKLQSIVMTKQFKVLNDHIKTDGGHKTVCVSTCLNFFGVSPDQYKYTSSNGNRKAYENVLRRAGYSVRSRCSEFRIKSNPTMTELKHRMKKSNYKHDDLFIVLGYQSRVAHLMVLNGNGDTVIDTAPNRKWRIEDINIVERV